MKISSTHILLVLIGVYIYISLSRLSKESFSGIPTNLIFRDGKWYTHKKRESIRSGF